MTDQIKLLRAQKALLEAHNRELRTEHFELTLRAAQDRQIVKCFQRLLGSVAVVCGDPCMDEISRELSEARHTLASPPTSDIGLQPGMPGSDLGPALMRRWIGDLEDLRRLIADTGHE